MSRMVGGDNVETTRTDQRGVYFGAVQFYLDDEIDRGLRRRRCARSPTARLLALPAPEFAAEFARWFPMAVHLLEGLLLGHAQRQRAGRPSGSGCSRWASCPPGSPTS